MGRHRYAIIGTGAVGGYYGGLLAHAGHEVHFLCHRDADHVRRHGLRVDSPRGGFVIGPDHVHAYSHAADMPACDVTVVCLKTTQNHLLPQLLPPVTGTRGVVLTLQNGLGVETAAAAVVGDDRVLGGLSFVCCRKAGPGHVVHEDYGQVRLGEHATHGVTERLASVTADWAGAGIDVEAVEDLVAARWHKLVWNVPFNGLSVVLDTTTDRLMADASSYSLCEALMREVQAGAAACGKTISDGFIRKMLDDTRKMTPYAPSMKQDWDARRPMELDALYAAPLAAAAASGVALPRLATLHALLRHLEAKVGLAT